MTHPLALACLLAASGADPGPWSRLPPLSDPEGVAGPFAGVSGGARLVAGGANFPVKKPWQGGRKVWHDTVYVLDRPAGNWKVAGKLPRPMGYGVSVTHRGSVVCAGGSDAVRHYPDVFRLTWKGGRLTTTALPAIPRPVANGCGVLLGERLYVIGGQQRPESTTALNAVHVLDLSAREPAWREEKPLPGAGRILAVAAASAGSVWVAGGASLSADKDGGAKRGWLKDGYRLRPGRVPERIADLPYPVVAAPSPAPADDKGFFVLGGDDGSKVSFSPDKHPGFVPDVLRFDVDSGKWTKSGRWPAPRVTVPAVRWAERWVMPSGEVRPGVRSPEVWSFVPKGEGR